MRLKSIRSWLPASYALIALLAAGVLGVVLLAILRGYYTQRELDYLTGNAQGVAGLLAQVSAQPLPPNVQNLAFLSQARVRLLDPRGQVLADSGPLPAQDVVFFASAGPQTMGATGFVVASEQMPVEGLPPGAVALPAAGTVYGFDFTTQVPGPDAPRSDQVVRQPWYDATGALAGYVELSEGPAYGRDILASVAWGWLLASAVAVALAAAAGWLVSRRLSEPLLALTGVTARMAGGDLTVRADTGRADELGQLARAFNDMAARIEETVVVLRRFAADAAHELHTPLTALRADLELAAGTEEAPDQRALLARTLGQANELQRLAAGLLDLSRLDAGVPEGPPAPVDLRALVQDAAERYAAQAEQAGVAFDLALPDAPVVVRGHGGQLGRALENLLDNALKFTPAGGRVQLELRGGEDGTVEIVVTDSGIGIPPEDLPRLFERFHRGRNATAYPGSGLGLAIAQAIVARHGGTLAAHDAELGARFVMQLPLNTMLSAEC
jgi:two-component system sensor histidine kinase BaeS